MKVILISDTHTKTRDLVIPKGDLLIHAGDITHDGSLEDINNFNIWLGYQKDKFTFGIVVVGGNHDLTFDKDHPKYNPLAKEILSNCTYLEDSGCEINGYRIWGSPMTPQFGWNWAFNRERGDEINKHWTLIPEDTDILITHGPPFGILDNPFGRQPSVGCADLLHRILEIKPKLHVFGHIHGGYGIKLLDGIAFVNASSVNEAYNPVNTPIALELT